jgi:two-component system, NtrC family, sensor histidine kinase HydH
VLVALFAVGLQVVVVTWAGDRSVLVAFGSVVVALVFVVGLAPLYASHAEQRARTEELLTLGRFARQFAHDVRNPLAAIKGAGQFLELELAEGTAARRPRRHAAHDRGAGRSRRAHALRPSALRAHPAGALRLELAPLVERALDAVGAAVAGVELARDFDPRCPSLDVDAELFAYALENVLRNAYEAMPDGGRITVRSLLLAEPAPKLELSVEDEGPGIDPSLVDRILDGHFSTKPGGSGLGLAFVRRVVEAHGGALRVESEVGRGTRRRALAPGSRVSLSARLKTRTNSRGARFLRRQRVSAVM